MPRKPLRPPRQLHRAGRLLAHVAELLEQARSKNKEVRAAALKKLGALPDPRPNANALERSISRSAKRTRERIQVQRIVYAAAGVLKTARRHFAPFYEVQETVEPDDIKQYAAKIPEFPVVMKALNMPLTDESIRTIVRTGPVALAGEEFRRRIGIEERAMKTRLYPRLLHHDGSLKTLRELVKAGTGQSPKQKKPPKT